MRALIAAAAVALTATPAVAGPLGALAGTEVLTCSNGVTPTSDVVLALLSSAGVPMTTEVLTEFQAGTLGNYMAKRLSDGKWVRLAILANSLVVDGPTQPEKGFAVSVGGRPEKTSVAVRELLNRNARWLTVNCTPEPPPPPPDPDADKEPDEQETNWVIARSLDDADKDTPDRDFATISYTRDYEAKDTIIATEVFIGLPSIDSGLGPDHTFRPYVLYQRRTGGDPLNDLTLGMSSRWFLRGNGFADHVFYLDGEFESDDDLDSEAWRGEFVWRPVLKGKNDPCGSRTGNTYGFSCRLRGVVDWQDVKDPGDKAALQDRPSFTRFGADLRFAAYWELAAGGGVEFDTVFAVREPFDGKEGDAAFGEASLRYVPAGLPNISFGVDYFEGEDLTSLERAKTLKFTFGFRN